MNNIQFFDSDIQTGSLVKKDNISLELTKEEGNNCP
jgi:hypothetical protein